MSRAAALAWLLALSCGDDRAAAPDGRPPDAPPPPPDGEHTYLVVGRNNSHVVIGRHHADGTLDPTYGPGGVVAIESALGGSAAALDGSGRVVVAAADVEAGRAAAFRLTCDGRLDGTFAERGYVTTTFLGYGSGIVIRDDGRLVLESFSSWDDAGYLWGILPGGRADAAFGTGGVVTVGSGHPGHLARGPGETLVSVGGPPYPEMKLVAFRWTGTGQPDAAFGRNGRAEVDLGAPVGPVVAAVSDRRIVAAISQDNQAAIIALRHDGSLDPSFGGGVVSFGSAYPATASWLAIAVTSWDGVVVAGWTSDGGPSQQALIARYTPAGTLDPSFGRGTGLVFLPAEVATWVTAILVEPDGGVIVAASHFQALDAYALIRLLPHGELDPAFGSGGITLVDGLSYPIALMRALPCAPGR